MATTQAPRALQQCYPGRMGHRPDRRPAHLPGRHARLLLRHRPPLQGTDPADADLLPTNADRHRRGHSGSA